MKNLMSALLMGILTLNVETFAQTAIDVDMVEIKGGRFDMGSPASEFERQKDERQHAVIVSDFSISRTEVTQALYSQVMKSNPSVRRGDRLPVENISWFDAVRFCNELSRINGLKPPYVISETSDGKISVRWDKEADGFRLPTEAEWEYAARAGTISPFNTGENINADQANYYGTYPYRDRPSQLYRGETIEVGQFKSNTWGLYDMHGNVWEWCWDIYGPYPTTETENPSGAEKGIYRVNRGGGFNDFGKHLRSAYRAAHNPHNKTFNIGMRLARNSQN